MAVIYGAYDTKNNEEVAVVGTPKEVAEYFKMSIKSLYSSVTKGCRIKHRYQIEKIDLREADYECSSN